MVIASNGTGLNATRFIERKFERRGPLEGVIVLSGVRVIGSDIKRRFAHMQPAILHRCTTCFVKKVHGEHKPRPVIAALYFSSHLPRIKNLEFAGLAICAQYSAAVREDDRRGWHLHFICLSPQLTDLHARWLVCKDCSRPSTCRGYLQIDLPWPPYPERFSWPHAAAAPSISSSLPTLVPFLHKPDRTKRKRWSRKMRELDC